MAKVRKWYVVAVGKEVGVFDNWLTTAPLVNGVEGAVWEGFTCREEAVRLFNEQRAKGNVRVVYTGAAHATRTQRISRTSSEPVVTNSSVPNKAGCSQSSHGINSVYQWDRSIQTSTPPQSPVHSDQRVNNSTRPLPQPGSNTGNVNMYRQGRNDREAVRPSRNRVHSEVGTRENVAFPRDRANMTPRSVQSRRTVPITSNDLQEEDRHSMLLRRDSDPAVCATPPVKPVHYDGLAPPVRRERSSSSESSGSAFSVVTCPESPIPSSDISLVGPLSSDDTGPVYPAFKMPVRRNPPAVRQADYTDNYADTDLLAEEFDKVDIYREDRRLPLLISSPRPSPAARNRPTLQQELLSPLRSSPHLRSPESLYGAQSATREQGPPMPTASPRAYSNVRTSASQTAVATPRRNRDARHVVVVPDSDDEEDRGRAGERRRSSLSSEKRALITRRWEQLAQHSLHVQSESHSSAFDPRSPMARGTSVPIDAVNDIFSRPSPRATYPTGATTLTSTTLHMFPFVAAFFSVYVVYFTILHQVRNMDSLDSFTLPGPSSSRRLMSESPLLPSRYSESDTGPGGADLSISELSLSDRDEISNRPFSLLARPDPVPSTPPTKEREFGDNSGDDEDPLDPDEEGDETIDQDKIKRIASRTREEKLRSDVFILRKLNAAFAAFNEGLEDAGSANERIATQLEQTDALLNQYAHVLSKSEDISRLIFDEEWQGAEEDETVLEQERIAAEEKARLEAQERALARKREQERLEREEQERLAQEEKERIDRERSQRHSSRGGVTGVRGTRASMRGVRGSTRASVVAPGGVAGTSTRSRPPSSQSAAGGGPTKRSATGTGIPTRGVVRRGYNPN
ncbi:hypothetical protein PC9H_007896 [Pleurotus ostreatus]|uniref:DASH complex subunit DUO1 n=1 Tax=Pleurotus ostreatus TaxID=5322 RepID=A0A8H6ZZ06_PLEOS|nr:uncharacterized protein PC9H_007896 [Pleurotus ostreatus]KAF7428667.1 hypothetical protein PC9H_007896 [Pleurotus ostreatus]